MKVIIHSITSCSRIDDAFAQAQISAQVKSSYLLSVEHSWRTAEWSSWTKRLAASTWKRMRKSKRQSKPSSRIVRYFASRTGWILLVCYSTHHQSLLLKPFLVFYDRILVMSTGRVAEFDTPLALFDKEESIFRSLCDEAGLTRTDIIRIREGAATN